MRTVVVLNAGSGAGGELGHLAPLWNAVSTRADWHLVEPGSAEEAQRMLLEELEREYIRHTLINTDASYADIADQLGISKKTLWEKRKRYNLDEEVDR